MKRASQKGFTLAELMVSLLVFSLVASIGVYTLRLGAEARDQLENSEAGMRDIELMRVLLKNDLLQITPRAARDEFGSGQEQWFYGGAAHPKSAVTTGETMLLSFVRGGWVNPEAVEPRSSLQYVEYLERENKLIRRVRPYLDSARNQPVAERVLFTDLSGVTIEFLRSEVRGRFDWVNDWPTLQTQTASPRVIALTLTDKRYGPMRYLFWVSEVEV